MEIHTIILAAVAILSVPLCAAYWSMSRKATQVYLDLLCKRDNSDLTADPRQWKRARRCQTAMAAGQLVLFAVWLFSLGDAQTTMDWAFTWAFAPTCLGFVLVQHHYLLEDWLNTIGRGRRSAQSLTAAV